MKKILCFILAGFLAVSAFAGTVRITLNGNKNFVVTIDGRTYTPNTASGSTKEIYITDLQNGQHTIAINRPNNRGISKEVYSSSFYLNSNENMHITVNGNGSVRIEESAGNEAYGDNSYRTPMSDASFNQLLRTISNKRGQTARLTAAQDIFNTSTNYFTTYQASDIIRLINAEANRLMLAKIAYDNLTDPANYTQFHNLLNRQASIDELDNYVRNNSTYTNPGNYNTYRTPMSDASYNSLYDNIRKKWLPGAKMSAASDAFNTETNYF